MEEQLVYVNGKARRAIVLHGREHVRMAYNLEVDKAELLKAKCNLIGEPPAHLVENLVNAFIEATGWGEEYKQPPVYEKRAGYHIKDAVERTKRGLFPWRISRN